MPQLKFLGKDEVANLHLSTPYRPLTVDKKRSLGDGSLEGNLIVQGDNLHALKTLLPHYQGRINCIYIDPPYNTGNEDWAYNDKVNSPLHKEWLGKVVGIDDQCRHDKWLCMMWPRLQLLKDLLAEDGVIFISIDDNEQHQLRNIMDEIFGAENYRNLLIIRRGAKNVQAQFEKIDRLNYGGEYVLVYTKDSDFRFDQFRLKREELRAGSWNNHWRGTNRPTMRYPLLGKTPQSGQWRWGKERSENAVENYQKMLKETGVDSSKITQDEIDAWWTKKFDLGEEVDMLRLSSTDKPEHYVPPSSSRIPSNLWTDLKPNGKSQLQALMGDQISFDTVKSVDLIKRLVLFSSRNKNSLILDSFAGSGTTAQAVLALNKEDGGNRKFILVECEEEIAPKITVERVRRVITGVKSAKDANLRKGLGGSFTYCTLGEAIEEEKMLSGKAMPSWETLARYVFYLATGETLKHPPRQNKKGVVGKTKDMRVYLLYKDDLEFMRSERCVLNLKRAETLIKDRKKGETLVVYAAAAYLSYTDLRKMHIRFCQLPYALNL